MLDVLHHCSLFSCAGCIALLLPFQLRWMYCTTAPISAGLDVVHHQHLEYIQHLQKWEGSGFKTTSGPGLQLCRHLPDSAWARSTIAVSIGCFLNFFRLIQSLFLSEARQLNYDLPRLLCSMHVALWLIPHLPSKPLHTLC